MSKTTYIIPVWFDDTYAKQVKKQLMEQGVPEELIIFTKEKMSRAKVLNIYMREVKTEYVGIFDDDVMLAPNVVEVLENLLDKHPNVGFAVAPVQQMTDLKVPKPTLNPNTPDEQALENISAKMWTFNATIYRKSCNVWMDEDFFGGQLIDWDFGLELLHKGYLSLQDHRTAVSHKQTAYEKKNLFYHAVVSRSRHIFMRKWQDRDVWFGLNNYNLLHNNEIPTLEELTHANEKWLLEYIAKYDPVGLVNCWLEPRFTDNTSIYHFLRDIEKTLKNTKQEFNPIITDMFRIPEFH